MVRKVDSLTTWSEYEKKLLESSSFRRAAKEVEHEYIVAKALIELRKRKGLTQKELAEKIGTKQPVISRIETGVVKPSIALLERIAQALGAQLEVRFRF